MQIYNEQKTILFIFIGFWLLSISKRTSPRVECYYQTKFIFYLDKIAMIQQAWRNLFKVPACFIQACSTTLQRFITFVMHISQGDLRWCAHCICIVLQSQFESCVNDVSELNQWAKSLLVRVAIMCEWKWVKLDSVQFTIRLDCTYVFISRFIKSSDRKKPAALDLSIFRHILKITRI